MTGTSPDHSEESPRPREPFAALADVFGSRGATEHDPFAHPPSVESEPVAVRYLVTPPASTTPTTSPPASTPAAGTPPATTPAPRATSDTTESRGSQEPLESSESPEAPEAPEPPQATAGATALATGAVTDRPRRRDSGQTGPARPPRRPGFGLPAVALLALLSAFFAWQSAEPLWLTIGHGHAGTATVTRCDPVDGTVAGPGVDPSATYRCVVFHSADGAFEATDVVLRGADPAEGERVAAWMVAGDREWAYVADPVDLYLRWGLGLLMVLACGGGIAWCSGARRLDRPWERRRAVLLSFAAPLAVTAGFLVAAV